MKILRWLLKKSNWVCYVPCKSQFRGKCYKKPPVNIVPRTVGGVTVPECRDIK